MGRAGESMRRDLSLIRRLEKIEKELGYCQIKLEKEQRRREADLEAVRKFAGKTSPR